MMTRKTDDQGDILVPHSAGYIYGQLPSLPHVSIPHFVHNIPLILSVDFNAQKRVVENRAYQSRDKCDLHHATRLPACCDPSEGISVFSISSPTLISPSTASGTSALSPSPNFLFFATLYAIH